MHKPLTPNATAETVRRMIAPEGCAAYDGGTFSDHGEFTFDLAARTVTCGLCAASVDPFLYVLSIEWNTNARAILVTDNTSATTGADA